MNCRIERHYLVRTFEDQILMQSKIMKSSLPGIAVDMIQAGR